MTRKSGLPASAKNAHAATVKVTKPATNENPLAITARVTIHATKPAVAISASA